MKKYFSFILLISAIAFPACRHKKEVVQITTVSVPAKETSAGSSDRKPATDSLIQAEKYRFIISFYSIGAGRDVKAYEKFRDYMDSYQKQKSKTIANEETPWGREGEVDYCIKLKELTETEQVDFIANLKIALADAKWVHYYENTSCRHKH